MSAPTVRGYGPASLVAKRALDVAIAVVVLTVSLVPMLIAGAAIRLTSRGPAFFRSQRAGVGGEPFTLVKLRTMHSAAQLEGAITGANDPRITRLGRLLRASKLDELPQFWNVLVGDMSIVGPRPENLDIVNLHYTDDQRRVLSVRPGITSMAQVEWYPDVMYHDPPPPGVDAATDYVERILPLKIELELRHLQRSSFWNDLRVIGLTAYCILFRSWRKPPKRSLESLR